MLLESRVQMTRRKVSAQGDGAHNNQVRGAILMRVSRCNVGDDSAAAPSVDGKRLMAREALERGKKRVTRENDEQRASRRQRR